jgi:hypothetical protein
MKIAVMFFFFFRRGQSARTSIHIQFKRSCFTRQSDIGDKLIILLEFYDVLICYGSIFSQVYNLFTCQIYITLYAIFIKKWYMFGYVTLNSLVYNEIISSADTSGGHNFLFLVIPTPNTCSSDSSTEWI